MTTYERCCRIIEEAPLDDLIEGLHGSELSDKALLLAEAFSAMTVGQLIEALHHDHRMSDRVRQAARAMVEPMNERAEVMCENEKEAAADFVHELWLGTSAPRLTGGEADA